MARQKYIHVPGPLASSYTGRLLECGLDEAGRGCLAGPVVAAAVVWPNELRLEGLNDSKQLTEVQRSALEPIIKEQALAWAVAEVSPQEIDQINILQASVKAMHLAAEAVMQHQQVDLLLVDGHYFKPYPFVPHECMVKGDARFMSIAAASILAKNHRDRVMVALAQDYPGYGWESNVGYPAPAHIRGLANLGVTVHHRLSYTLKGVPLGTFGKQKS